MYPLGPEITEITDKATIVLILDLELNINGHLSTTIYETQDNFNFEIIHFSHLSGNTSTTDAYGIYIPY